MTGAPDFSLIGEDPPDQAATSAALTDVSAEQEQLDRDQLQAKIDDMRALTALKLKFGQQILAYLWAFSAFCALVLLLQGFSVGRFGLPVQVLVTLVGGTAASALGLVSVVLGGLFRNAGEGGFLPR